MPEQIYARYLKPGEVLFREGEAGDDAYIVEKGEIEISIDLPTDKKVIAELGKGEIIGEMSLIADAPRSATASTWRRMSPRPTSTARPTWRSMGRPSCTGACTATPTATRAPSSTS